MATPTDIDALNYNVIIDASATLDIVCNTSGYSSGTVAQISILVTKVAVNDIVLYKDGVSFSTGSDTFVIVDQKDCLIKSTAALP